VTYARRIDTNHREIEAAFRSLGCTVFDTSRVGGGFPDMVVGVTGINLLVEVKDGARPPSERRLNAAEREFHDSWRGQVVVVETVDQAIDLVNSVRS